MEQNEALSIAKKLLEENKLVAIPTETVYGLAANALSTEAVAKIFQAKNRPTFDPLIVHVADIAKVNQYVDEFPVQAQALAEVFWAGPLTLILNKKPIVPDLVTAGMNTVAIRIPRHPLTQALLQSLDFPLAAPSANPFGYVSPTTAFHVKQQLGGKIDYVLDGGACKVGIESTIVGFNEGKPLVYRLGGVSLEAIERVVGKVAFQAYSSSNPQAPGMLSSHYAPSKPLYIIKNQQEAENWLKKFPIAAIGTLRFREYLSEVPIQNQVILSQQGDFGEAAQHLFAGMRSLDRPKIEIILAELLPEENLGRAINDRIRRAAVVHQSFD